MGYKEKKRYGEYLPAYDESMEKAVIGAMLIERQAAPIAIPLLRPEMFYYQEARNHFQGVKRHDEPGQTDRHHHGGRLYAQRWHA